MKQVPVCEYNPFEAVKTNVVGAENVVRAIRDHELGVETVIVRVEGRRSRLRALREEDFRAEVSLKGAQPGRFVLSVANSPTTVGRRHCNPAGVVR